MRRSKTESIDLIINSYLKKSGLGRKFKEIEIIEAWEEIVGLSISSRTEKIYVQDFKLYVKLNSPIVKSELLMLKKGIVLRLNKKVGEKIIDDLIIY